MFGLFRLILALLVSQSHITGPINHPLLAPLTPHFNPGSFAVIGFYILSGFLMTAIIRTKFSTARGVAIKNFYTHRLLRIFPLYYFYLFLTLILLIINRQFVFSFLGTLAHLTIIPLNYYQLIHVNLQTHTVNPAITPAWSLAAELQFYLLIPFLITRPRLKLTLFITSLLSFILTAANLNEPFFATYIAPTGMLFAFLTGSYLWDYQTNRRGQEALLICLTWIILFAFLFYLFARHHTAAGVNAELTLGFLLLAPAISILSKLRGGGAADNFLGGLAYPVFLSHSLAQKITPHPWPAYLLTLALSLAGYLIIDTPATILRHRLFPQRGKHRR